jgi:hypothetical protein
MRRRGIVWIAPTDSVPIGCMADPATSTFWVSWQDQDDGLLGDADVVGAEAATGSIESGHSPATGSECSNADNPEWGTARPVGVRRSDVRQTVTPRRPAT